MTTPSRLRSVTAIGVFGLIAAMFYVYPLFLRIPLLDADEGLHAAIAQEMVERGDYTSPRLFGEPFQDKPIFYFWMQALSLKFVGMNEVGVRLPGLLFGFLGTVSTGLLAWCLFNRLTGMLAALCYMMMVLPIAFSQAPVHDVALVPWTNCALLSCWLALRAPDRRKSVLLWLAAGLFIGLACLTKGLIGVAIIYVALVGYLILSRKARWSAWFGLVLAAFVAAIVAGPWFLAMNLRYPGYAYYYFVERHLFGYLTETQTHGRAPWWYYLPILLSGGLPWAVYLPAAAQAWWQQRGQGNRDLVDPLTFTWIWLAGGVLFLSLAHSKLLTYMAPLFPAVAILAAVPWSRLSTGHANAALRRTLNRTMLAAYFAGPLALPGAMYLASREFEVAYSSPIWALGILISCVSWLPLIFAPLRDRLRPLGVGFAFLLANFVFIMTAIVPPLAEARSTKPLAAYFNQNGVVPEHLFVVHERIPSLIFYLDPQIRARLRPGNLRTVDYDVVLESPEIPPGSTVIVPEEEIDRLHEHAYTGKEIAGFGHFHIYQQHRIQGTMATRANHEQPIPRPARQ